MTSPIRLGILTVSDAASRGDREDTSGGAIRDWAGDAGFTVVRHDVIPDDEKGIRERLQELIDEDAPDLILTTGGTGFTARDVTPEATRALVQREAPGIAEAIRLVGADSVKTAWLSRGVAGIRDRTLIVNLPGSTGGVRDGLNVLDDLVEHAVQLLRGDDTGSHPAPEPSDSSHG